MEKIDHIRNKILDRIHLERFLAIWRFQDLKIVFTNGCFDILHRGHIEYLARAASLGDILVLGLNTDRSVKKIKGNLRPVQDERSRALVLASLSFVSAIVLFSEETPYELIKTIQPNILVKGADYAPEDIAGYDIVNSKGGKVVTIELTEGYSTTKLIERLNTGKA
jgi:rfaE bifunctional protein nucleotidyltransferase chain/domain